jgi:predicted phage terminase large subunit-like protein
MQQDWYKRIFPSTRLNPRRQPEHDFWTTSGGYRLATSTGGTLTGRGGDLIIVDDPLKADDAWSETRRKNSVEWTKSTLFSRLDDKKHGSIIVTQQRLHEEDLSGYLIRTGGWLELVLPAIAEDDQSYPVGPNQLYHRKAGELLDPEREPLETLEQAKRELGTAVFSAQYQQSPTPADGDVIKLSWFKRYDHVPSGGEIIISVDTASKVGEHNDYSAVSIWRFVGGRYYLEFVWRDKVKYPDLKRKVIALSQIYAPHRIIIEDKVAGMGLIQDLHEDAPELPVVAYVPEVDKLTRMHRHSARIEAGQVYLPREEHWLADFELEIRQFPNGKHDDMVDSMSQMLDHYSARQTGTLIIGSFRS